jgi:hypothetical protein
MALTDSIPGLDRLCWWWSTHFSEWRLETSNHQASKSAIRQEFDQSNSINQAREGNQAGMFS